MTLRPIIRVPTSPTSATIENSKNYALTPKNSKFDFLNLHINRKY